MENLKIRVNSADESKEAQKLFFELGYGFEGNTVKETQEFEYTGVFYLFAYGNDCDLTYSTDRELFNSKLLHKEITLPELSAMANPVKEWLNTKTFEYKQAACMFGHSEWIEIPEGAEIAIKFNIDDDEHGVIFYKNDGKASAYFKWDYGSQWSNAELLDENFAYGDTDLSHKVLWQRQTQPKALPSIDDEPKYTYDEVKYMDENGQGRLRSINDQYAEIEQVRQAIKVKSGSDSDHALDAMSFGLMGAGAAQASGGVDATLAERQAQYGSFEDVAFVTENIISILKRCNYDSMPNPHKMAMYMIASKMARLVSGDCNHLDSWHDIGGYSKLIENLIEGK